MAEEQTITAFTSLEIPTRLVDSMITMQQGRDEMEPQHRDAIHLTLAFLGRLDAEKLADAAAFLSGKTWTAPLIRFTGQVRHGSWALKSDPDYHYDEATIQKGEQIRLGIEPVPELLGIYSDLTRNLGGAEDDYWPHVTLGVARRDVPAASMNTLDIPRQGGPARSLDLRQESEEAHHRVLVTRDFS